MKRQDVVQFYEDLADDIGRNEKIDELLETLFDTLYDLESELEYKEKENELGRELDVFDKIGICNAKAHVLVQKIIERS